MLLISLAEIPIIKIVGNEIAKVLSLEVILSVHFTPPKFRSVRNVNLSRTSQPGVI